MVKLSKGYRWYICLESNALNERKNNVKIAKLKTNHMTNSLGFDLGKPHLSYVVSAEVILPYAKLEAVTLNDSLLCNSKLDRRQDVNKVAAKLESGNWKFSYMPTDEFIRYYSTYDSVDELFKNEEAKKLVVEAIPFIATLTPDIYVESIGEMPINPFFLNVPHTKITNEIMDSLDVLLGKIQK